jgi:hypothetical protein
MTFDEIDDRSRHVPQLQITAPAQLLGDVRRNILRPAVEWIEAKDADRVALLPLEHVQDHSFKVRGVDVGFAPNAA